MSGILAGGFSAIVAADAVSRNPAVVEHRTGPVVGGVAVVTGVVTGDVGGVLAGGGAAVVAGRTGPDDIGVVDADHGYPAGVAVAVFAQAVGLDVLRVLAGGGGAVVTAGATAGGDPTYQAPLVRALLQDRFRNQSLV